VTDYEIRTDGMDVDRIYHWLSTDAYWAPGRTREMVATSLANSYCLGAFVEDGTQVALARAVTDWTTFAWIADVYVDRAHRGQGLGTRLVDQLRATLQEAGIPRIVLATKDAHGVYAKIGFAALRWPERWMEIDRR
jgi:predicted GNAT family acetyltransferase